MPYLKNYGIGTGSRVVDDRFSIDVISVLFFMYPVHVTLVFISRDNVLYCTL